MFLSRKKTLNMGRLQSEIQNVKKADRWNQTFHLLTISFFSFFTWFWYFFCQILLQKKKKNHSQATKPTLSSARITEENATEHQRERQPHWSRVYFFFLLIFHIYIYYIFFSPERNKQDPRKEDRSSILLPVVNKGRETPTLFYYCPSLSLSLSLIRVFGFCFLFF